MLAQPRNNKITMHPREQLDLNEFFVLLTYRCNGNCPFCIESNVHEQSDLSDLNFDKALEYAREHDLPNLFLHGGEPSVHHSIVSFAQKAKDAGFTVQMFTNGIDFETLKKLDGIMDEIKVSYRGDYSLRFHQEEWSTHLALEILATESMFPSLESLLNFVQYARDTTGMKVYVNTLNPVNQNAYDNQYVSYLEDLFLEIPDDEIFCTSNKATFKLPDGTNARLGNKNLNPGHVKYSMSPDGKIRDRFERKLDLIHKDPDMERKLSMSLDKVLRLRSVTC